MTFWEDILEIQLNGIMNYASSVKCLVSESWLNVKENGAIKRAIVEGSGGVFLMGKEAKDEIQLFLRNAGTTMRPLTAAAGGNSRYF
ncbi:5-enol-pyruvylshikimate-phosphate synthase [Tanacetum coccineum]